MQLDQNELSLCLPGLLSSLIPGLDDKHKGKPVIFVSAFGLYNPSELQTIYET